jgi:hypothetical protein
MRHGQPRALFTPAYRQPPVLRTAIGAPGSRRGLGGLDRRGPQEAILFAGLARRPLAGACILTRGAPGLRRQVAGMGQARHLGAELGHEHFRRAASPPGLVSSQPTAAATGPQIA